MQKIKRIFHAGELSGVVELSEEEARRVRTVLRMQNGDKIELLSEKSLACGVVAMAGKRSVLVQIESIRNVIHPAYEFIVYQCLAKREYMDFIIEKYAELGVTKIVPVLSQRSMSALKPSALLRLRAIALEATLQSENEVVPEITSAVNISSIIPSSKVNILFHERTGEHGFLIHKTDSVSVIIGAEGGFTDFETEVLIERGFQSCTPINCVLKAETAALLFSGMVRVLCIK